MVWLALACSSPAPDVQVYAGAAVENPLEAVEALKKGLQPYGVDLSFSSSVTRISARHVVGSVGGDPLAELRTFVNAHARKGTQVHLVVLDRIVDPSSPLASQLHLEGMGLHEDSGTEASQKIIAELGDFAPLVFVDRHHLEPSLLVHEFGHARGLPHHPDPKNLMHAKRGTELTDAQIARIRGTAR